jgi:rare lipoprotein A
MAPYSVGGRTYVPLREWRGYTEEGIASWYGPGHHGRPTASGERFDMNRMTAAHPVLPMQVCLRVSNVENDRVVVVRVNDRGPFKDGRVVDLSQAAARALGMLPRGTARVRLATLALADPTGRCPSADGSTRFDQGGGPLLVLARAEPGPTAHQRRSER